MYVAYSRPNGWIDWAEICFGHSWVSGRYYRLKINQNFEKILNFLSFHFFLQGQRRALQLVCNKNKKKFFRT